MLRIERDILNRYMEKLAAPSFELLNKHLKGRVGKLNRTATKLTNWSNQIKDSEQALNALRDSRMRDTVRGGVRGAVVGAVANPTWKFVSNLFKRGPNKANYGLKDYARFAGQGGIYGGVIGAAQGYGSNALNSFNKLNEIQNLQNKYNAGSAKYQKALKRFEDAHSQAASNKINELQGLIQKGDTHTQGINDLIEGIKSSGSTAGMGSDLMQPYQRYKDNPMQNLTGMLTPDMSKVTNVNISKPEDYLSWFADLNNATEHLNQVLPGRSRLHQALEDYAASRGAFDA